MSSVGRPVYSEAGWVPHSVVFASGEDLVCVPLANEGVGFGLLLLALLPLALPWGLVCFGGLAMIFFFFFFFFFFHLGVFVHWSSMHGGLLAALPEVKLLGMGFWFMFRVPQILCFTSLPGDEVVASGFWHGGTGVAPGSVPSSWRGCLPGAGSECVRL